MSRIGVTGADGFVGGPLCRHLQAQGHDIRPLVRDAECAARFGALGLANAQPRLFGDLGPDTCWDGALDGLDAVIHLAARVHVMDETEADPPAAFRLVNTAGTERLARAAVEAGARRFVYVSTIKVNGESTDGRRPFRADDPPAPGDPYAVSKHEAEQALTRLASGTDLEPVIVRPPLVHGPGVGGNLVRLLALVRGGWPLPFGRAANRRALIGVENLASALAACAVDERAAGGTFLVSDGRDLPLRELVTVLAEGLRVPARLVPIPTAPLRTGARLLGRAAVFDRLYGSLEVDIGGIRESLDWEPPVSAAEGLARMCAWYRGR